MSWGLGWKRSSDSFHLTLSYGTDDGFDDASPSPSRSSSSSPVAGGGSSPLSPMSPTATSLPGSNHEHLGFRIDLDWTAGEDEDQVALRLQSQVMVALPSPQDSVEVELKAKGAKSTDGEEGGNDFGSFEDGEDGLDTSEVQVEMRVVKRKEPLKGVLMFKAGGSGHQSDGMGVLARLMRSNFANEAGGGGGAGEGVGVRVGVCAEHWKSVTAISLCALGLSVSDFSFNSLSASCL